MKPGEYFLNEAGGPIEANAGRTTARVIVRNCRRSPGPGRQPFPFFRNQSRTGIRSRLRLRHAPEYSRRHRGAFRAGRGKRNRADAVRRPPRDARLQRLGGRPARRRRRAAITLSLARKKRDSARAVAAIRRTAHEPENSSPHLRRSVRPNDRRPHPSGRHRTDNRNRKGLHALRRRDHFRRRQSNSRRHGTERRAPRENANTARWTS